MHEQRIVLDVAGEENARLTVAGLVERFEREGKSRASTTGFFCRTRFQ
jgi:ABC-type uncharacterized transport system ATPase component